MSDEFFSSEFPDLQKMINQLDLMNDNVNKAVRESINEGADKILAEQRRLAAMTNVPGLPQAVTKSRIYTTKKGIIGISSGYHSGAFKEKDGKNLGVIGMTYEFGRPGQSPNRNGKTIKQNRKGKEVEVNKGTIQPIPHIRRGFDNKIEEACNIVIKSVTDEIEKL